MNFTVPAAQVDDEPLLTAVERRSRLWLRLADDRTGLWLKRHRPQPLVRCVWRIIDIGTIFVGELEWKTPIFSWRVITKTPTASYVDALRHLRLRGVTVADVRNAQG